MKKQKFLLLVLTILVIFPACNKKPADDKPYYLLPAPLEEYRDKINQSVLPYVKIKGTVSATKIRDSKFAGDPYFPKSAEYPLDEKGHPMKLLAQINFSELPQNSQFPQKGILEFFISIYDDILGLDFDEPASQKNFRVIYFEDISDDDGSLVSDFSFITEPEDYWFPVPQEARLTFSAGSEAVSLGDYRFSAFFGDDFYSFFERFGSQQDRIFDFYAQTFSGTGHKMGGYAFFTQHDPRSYKNGDYETLLLQVDSDDALDIMWGDVGVANFFIKPSDLENRDFSKVMYNWDCY